jgi:hypothetical protein
MTSTGATDADASATPYMNFLERFPVSPEITDLQVE